MAIALDLYWFLAQHALQSHLSNSFQPAKLALLGGLYAALAALLVTIVAKAAVRSRPLLRLVSEWSPWAVVIWFLLSFYLALVYYPLPSHPHHLDKLLFILSGLLAWTLWMVVHPAGLAGVLNGRVYGWVRLGLINLFIFLMIGETAVRLADPLLAKDGLYSRAESSQWLKPHVQTEGSIGHTNVYGFRDREWTVGTPHSAVRVLALGDSFTWGTGVTYDEGVVATLERALRDRLPHAEVINLGVPGFEPEHELDLFRQFGVHLDPDGVLVNFFVGNDIMRKRGAGRESAVIVAGKIFYVHHSGNWIHDHWGPDRWYLYHNLNYLIRVDLSPIRRWFRRQQPASGGTSIGQPSTVTSTPPQASPVPEGWNLDYLSYLNERSDIFAKENSEEWEFHWRFTQATLDALLRDLRARQIPVVVAIIPEQIQLDREWQHGFLSAIGASPDAYDFLKPQKALGEWCDSREVACVDLLAKWGHDAGRTALYLPNDTHWSREGHRRAAADIFPMLLAQLTPVVAKRDHDPSSPPNR